LNHESEERRTPHAGSVGGRARAYISSNSPLFVISGFVALVGFFAIATNSQYHSLGSALANGFGAGFTFWGIAFFIGLLIRKLVGLVGRRRGFSADRNASIERNLPRGSKTLSSATSWESGRGLAPSLTSEGRGSGDGSLLNSGPVSEPQWKTPATGIGGGLVSVDTNGQIFVVHGHARTVLHELVRVLERGTGREVIVLHEQANSGKTILEKFEEHAAAAAYAVVLLTGDDEGRALSASEPRARGRQNVIFELGFFFGKLGRERVTVLVDRHVEKPSDIDGLVYIPIDEAGAWKQALARELQSASIQVNYSRIP
jgi:Predicted nucleotide-binding protein containing TIR-like domain